MESKTEQPTDESLEDKLDNYSTNPQAEPELPPLDFLKHMQEELNEIRSATDNFEENKLPELLKIGELQLSSFKFDVSELSKIATKLFENPAVGKHLHSLEQKKILGVPGGVG